MLTNFVCTSKELKEIKINELKNYVGKRGSTVWINAQNVENEEVAVLKELFKLHPTTIEDIFSQQTPIKYENFGDYRVIIFKGIKEIKKRTATTYNISFVIGDNFIITVSNMKDGTVDDLIDNEKKIQYLLTKGKKYLMHYILDKEVDEYVRRRAQLSEDLNKIEIEFINGQNKETLTKVYGKELAFLELRHLAESVADLCLNLTKTTENPEDKSLIPYFKDIYDHAAKTAENYKAMLERTTGMEEMYATITSLKTNEVMRSLTIIMALMMPLTIITGFYGMNVKLPFQDYPQIWIFLLAAMMLSAVVMILISKRRGWIAGKE